MDGCSAHDIEKLEKVQFSAARIFTDLPIFTSRKSLYTGWQTYQNRGYAAAKMFKIYKRNNSDTPFSWEHNEMYNISLL